MEHYMTDPVKKAGRELAVAKNRVKRATLKLHELEAEMELKWDALEAVAAEHGREVPEQHRR